MMRTINIKWSVLRLLLGVGLLLSNALGAATFDILVDKDNNAATGCTVAAPAGPFPGVEFIVTTTVNTGVYPPVVTGVTRRDCAAPPSTFGPSFTVDAGSWPVGIGNGTGGYDVLETYFPIAAPYGQFRMGFVYTDPNAGSDAVLTTDGLAGGNSIIFDMGSFPVIPTLAHGTLFLLAFALAWLALRRLRQHKVSTLIIAGVLATIVAGTTWAAFVLDGLIADWAGVPALATDPTGDAPGGADIAAIFAKLEGQKFFVRADVKTASPPSFTSTNAATFTVGTPGSFAITTFGIPAVGTITQGGALPAGVTFTDNGNGTATLSGTPAAGTGGVYLLTFTATNGVPPPANQNFTLTINQAPALTSANNATFKVGTAGTFSVTTSGFPTNAAMLISESGALPGGVTFVNNNDGTATLAGTPNAGTGGTYPFTITANNGIAPNATQSFTLTVNQAPAITSANNATFQTGVAGSFTVTTTGFPSGASMVIGASGALPAGVTFVNNGNGTATLAGTPNAGTGGSYALTITANNGVTPNATQNFTLTVNQPPALTSANATTFTVGTAGSFTVTTTGFPTNAAMLISESGALPGGVTFVNNNDGTATLAGTPNAGTGGTYPLTISASNGVGSPANQSFTLTVNEAPTAVDDPGYTVLTGGTLAVTVGGTPDGLLANDARGFPAATIVTFGGGSMGGAVTDHPAGTPILFSGYSLQVNADGSFTFIAAAGSFGNVTFQYRLSNGSGTSDATVTIAVQKAPLITSANTTSFQPGVAGSFTVTTSGFPTPTLAASAFTPAAGWLSFTDNGNGTATLAGTPPALATGSITFTITAHNIIAPDATQNFTLLLQSPPAITSGNSLTCVVGTPCPAFTVTATGVPTPTLSETGALPNNVTFTPGTGVLGGTPQAGTGAVYNISFKAANGVLPDATQPFTLTINEAPATPTGPTPVTFVVGTAGTFNYAATGFPAPTFTLTGCAPSLPGAITISSAGVLSGTATTGTGGDYNCNVQASNGIGSPATEPIVVQIREAPLFTSANNATFTVGVAGTTFQLAASGFPAAMTFTNTGAALPANLNLSAGGLLSGTPAVGTGGVKSLQFTASNGIAPAANQAFTLTINEPPTANADPTGGIPSNSTPGSTPYHIALNGAIVSGSSPNLLANDNVGFPAATVSSFGPSTGLETTVASNANGTSAAGGVVKVLANGTFDYTPSSATFTGLDSFKYTITSTSGSSTAVVSLAVGVRPAAGNDTYPTTLIGNVKIDTAVSSGFSVLSNDTGDQRTAALVSATNGQATMAANGTFTFNPNPGYAGSTATITYTVNNGFGASSNGTVTLTVSASRVWFIDQNAVSSGDGRLGTPFKNLANLAGDVAGDNIFLYSSGTNYTGPITLKSTQKLIGQGASSSLATIAGLTFPADSAPPATGGARPVIDTNGITLNTNNTIRGLNVATTGNNSKLTGSVFGTLTIGDNTTPDVAFIGTGKSFDLVNGTFAATSALSSLESTSSASGQHGLKFDTVHGTIAMGSTTIHHSGIQAMFIFNSDVDVNFGNTVIGVSGTALSGSGPGAEGIRFESNTGGTRTFNALTISETTAQGMQIFGTLASVGGGKIAVTGTTTVSNPGAAGILISNADLGHGASFVDVTVTGSAGTGVGLTDNQGTITFANLNIAPDSGQAGLVVNNTAVGTPGTITTTGGTITTTGAAAGVQIVGFNTANRQPLAMVLAGVTSPGGTNNVLLTNVSGSLAMNGGALSGSTAAAFNVSGSTATISYAGSIANSTGGVSLTNNTGATISFTGGMTLSTGANPAFTATGGGTVSATQNNTSIVNTLTTTTATALNVANTTIGASGLTFRSISSGTGSGSTATGIILDTTGSSGGLHVTGTGTAGSGGTIQHKTGADGSNTTGTGIFLNSTSDAQFAWMQLNDFNNSAIRGLSVTGFKLTNSVISGVIGDSTGATEGAITFGTSNPGGANGLLGTGTSASLIDNVNISGSIEHQLEFYNQSGSFGLTISNSNIHNNSVAGGSDGILVEMQGTASTTLNFHNNTFDDNKSQAIQIAANDDSTINATINNNIVLRSTQGNEGFVLSNGSNGDLTAAITNNTMSGLGGVMIFVGQTAGNASASSLLQATISGNNITTPTTATNHAIIAFMTSTVGQVSQAKILIDNNTITQNSTSGVARGILVDTPDTSTSPNFDATATNNTVHVMDNIAGVGGIVVQARKASTGHFDVRSNTVNFPNGTPAFVNGLRVRQVDTATAQLARGVDTLATPVATVLADNNPASTTEILGTVTVINNGIVLLPASPTLP